MANLRALGALFTARPIADVVRPANRAILTGLAISASTGGSRAPVRSGGSPAGVDVIVGEKALIVDRSYHVLRMNGLPELRAIGWLDNSATAGRPPDCLEFRLAYPRGRYGGIRYTTLRVPVPAAALEQGRRAYDQFAPALERRLARGPLAMRNPRRTLQVCGAILAVGGATAAWGWIEAETVGWNLYNSLKPVLLLLGGGAAVLFAVLLAALTLLLRPRRQ